MTEMVIADLAPVKNRAAFVSMTMGISVLVPWPVRPWAVLSCSTQRGDGFHSPYRPLLRLSIELLHNRNGATGLYTRHAQGYGILSRSP